VVSLHPGMARRAEWIREATAYVVAAALSLIAAVVVFKVWRADLRVPFDYGGDALLMAVGVKSMLDHGWIFENPSLGAPLGMQFYDFPFLAHATVHLVAMKAMALVTGDWALIFNLYFLLGSPFIALAALAVFRQFGVRAGPAVVCSVLYSCLPSRLMKGEGHLFLDVFYDVPLTLLVVLWVCGDTPPLFADPAPGGRWPRLDVRRGRALVAVILCVFKGCADIYFTAFIACLLVAGGAWASRGRGSPANAASAAALATVLFASITANVFPSVLYPLRHGPNPAGLVRRASDAEIFGMRIVQLVLPVPQHRLPALAQTTESYSAHAPLVGENATTALGAVATVGFLVLLVLVARAPSPGDPRASLLRRLSFLNFAAVLLATTGGFGALVSLLVAPEIRAYMRMNVVIGFLAFFAVALLLERWHARHRASLLVALPILLVAGLADQSTAAVPRRYEDVKRAYDDDAKFVSDVEAALPAGSAVFELPYMGFPESPPLHRMEAYDLARPYLHSRALRWSFPAMRGRSGDLWARDVASRGAQAMLTALAGAGFAGIVIDRDGYEDSGAAIEAALRDLEGGPPLVSPDGTFAFFRVPDLGAPALTGRAREIALHPLVVQWMSGCYGLERTPDGSLRWCGRSAEIRVQNETSYDRTATLVATFFAARPPAHLTLDGETISMSVALERPGTPVAREIAVGPGDHLLRFRCDGTAAPTTAGDPREMVWHADDFALRETTAP
jgi:phosphoglycerol transferase